MSSDDILLADANPPICSLNCQGAFEKLTDKEKLYSFWLSRASWAGGDIIRRTWTSYAVDLNRLLLILFSTAEHEVVDFSRLQSSSGVTNEDFQSILAYSTQVLSNLCNYRTFGDVKFLPRCDRAAFQRVVQACPRAKEALPLWQRLGEEMYTNEPTHIGKTFSGYYPDCKVPMNDQDVSTVLKLANEANISSLNTRVRKDAEGVFTLLIASSDPSTGARPQTLASDLPKAIVTLEYQDHKLELGKAVAALERAKHYAANEKQFNMLQHYITSFQKGDVEAHKAGSSEWVKDQGPVVESYLGFIETYVDPWQIRAEWEGFVSIVDKTLSARFAALVSLAPTIIETLPWPRAFENSVFTKPDYSGLTVLSFATGGIPAGINIPNYDDVRASEGYKNVSLLNILNAKAPNEEIKFVKAEDRDLLEKWQSTTFEVQVACHELLGHGTGKIFRENADGTFNFDRDTINPLTKRPVETWYKSNETPNSKLGSVYGTFEEMRAEAVGMYLCGHQSILEIFDLGDHLSTIPYVNYLIMARAGLRALEFFDLKTAKFSQAHMGARFGIFRTLIRERVASLHIERDGESNIIQAHVEIDRAAVLNGSAKHSMGRVLIELQVRRSLGDQSATQFIAELTNVPSEWAGPLRDFVIANRTPRKCFLQPNLELQGDDKVIMKDYPATLQGFITSCVERHE